ncbi:hypothetical protein Desaci_3856 [Desulfosporosinus acidiphilus SJ4]|uniref:Uncharacterized protein n=1 Tax=Desulfosporosinus acidiphilus (strain DSM 22704 / JCM 16185 / SJ4) TaxID=646529 RepID=I4DAB3_DESAJ|nr:DUF6470 family protein [Desulfosporosinus acidiphilus]AFM42737.1 hypothetical protein Desaci_3856 [Desulfosporosinus acidiphilus SJ4]
MIDLRIQQQFGTIGLDITPFHYDLSITHADLEIQQKPAEISLQQPAATLEIDNTPARESLGYYGIAAQKQVNDQEAKEACDKGISRIVSEGDQFRDLSNKASVAKIVTKDDEPQQKKIQIACIRPIQITVTENPVECQVETGGVSVSATMGTIQGELQYGSAHAYMEQNPYIQFYTVGSIYDGSK